MTYLCAWVKGSEKSGRKAGCPVLSKAASENLLGCHLVLVWGIGTNSSPGAAVTSGMHRQNIGVAALG